MIEAEWLRCTDPLLMLRALKGKVSDRKLRLFACASCRLAWHLLSSASSREAVEVAERLADGEVTREEAAAVADKVYRGPIDRRPAYIEASYAAQCAAGMIQVGEAARQAGSYAGVPPPAQVRLLHDIFANPFRPAAFDPAWLTGEVTALAEAAYQERLLPTGELDPPRLAVLADALEEVGAAGELLAHLRGPGPHVRGCFAVDLAAGRG